MAIYTQLKEISAVYKGKSAIASIYKGAKLVWEAVRSCFGKGFWIQTYPWDNNDGWKNID